MDDKLRKELKAKKISEMKNPTILMNENDFEVFKKEIDCLFFLVLLHKLDYLQLQRLFLILKSWQLQ
jgi:hypothetical protein